MHGIGCIVVTFTLQWANDRNYTITQEFVYDKRGFFFKAALNMLAMQTEIWTYFVAFCFQEAMLIGCGLGFKIEDNGKLEYNSVRAIDIWNMMTCYELVTYLRCWNISVHTWLKNYVMIRLLDKTKRGL